MMSMNEISECGRTYVSFEDGKFTAWDSPGPGRQEAVWAKGCYDQLVVLTTDPDAIHELLEDEGTDGG